MGEIELAAVVLLAIVLLLAVMGGILVVLLLNQRQQPRLATPRPMPMRGSMMRQERGQGVRYLSVTPSALLQARGYGPPTPHRRPSGPMGRLWIENGPLQGSRYALSRPSLALGRSATCDISLPDAEASRQHARLEWALDGLYVVDTHSTNGTYVNGRRVGQARLRGGERIQIGRTTLIIDIR